MLARIQQLIVFLIAAALVGGLIVAHQTGRPEWALVPPLILAGGYAAALGIEFAWLRRSYDPASPDRPSVRQLLAAWFEESLMGPRVFLWRQPFRAAAVPDSIPADAKGRRGVLLVHGFFCNRGLWNPWMRRLRPLGIPFLAVNLEPPFGSIDRYREIIDAGVRRLDDATGLAPVIVGHSMGGLAVRSWRRTCDPQARRFHRIVTIGTPHRGTWLARHARTANGREMQLESAWLAGLGEGEAAHDRFTCFWGHCDNIVFPTRGATLPGADNRHVAGTPHVAMAFHSEVLDHVLQLLKER